MKLTKQNLLWSLLFGGKGGGITPSGTLSIASNGTYDVGAFAEASVLVPASAVVSGTKQISANGTHDVTAFANAEVLVPASAVDVGTKSISENGTHDVVGFANVDVNVAASGGNEDDLIVRSSSFTSYANNRVTEIGEGVFAYAHYLNSVSFPNVSKVGKMAFYSCGIKEITSSNFPLLSSMSAQAFANCGSLSVVELGSIALSIYASSVFENCISLVSVTSPYFPIAPDKAFCNCNNLTTCSLGGIYDVRSSAFYNCKISEFYFSYNSYSRLFISSGGFYYARSLSKVIFPSNAIVATLQPLAFGQCETLSKIVFPLTPSIAASVFSRCYTLTSLYLLGSSVCQLANANAFFSTPIYNYTASTGGVVGSIFVPSSLYSTYISSTNWVTFSSRFVSLTDDEIAAVWANNQ